MSTTLTSQHVAQHLSLCASTAAHAFSADGHTSANEAAPVYAQVVPATTTGNVVTDLGHGMAWLGGPGEDVCVSDKQFTKRIITGRLVRALT